ncbi:MAG TPA: MBL fold metallo-hydrolase [Candidatus Cloacimonadota bacterium]|nr:MBL fold metallo-hydrolase [Candidatus Cloacimonadota bacterium]HPT70744.1 MBL fold metallo-hydrolase [Candidatus Cloacimonadota bacterium]
MINKARIDQQITIYSSEQSHVNAIVIETEKHLVCIDTLHRPADSKELASQILSHDKPLKYLINTHGHSDHCLGNRFLKQQETFILAHEKFARTALAESAFLKNTSKRLSIDRILQPDICFKSDIQLPDSNIEVHHAPGHSPDSIIVHLPNKKIIVAGDTVLNGEIGKITVPYIYWGDLEQMQSTLQKIVDLQPEIIIPGHGLPCDMEKIQTDITYLKNLKEKLDELLELYQGEQVDKLKEMAYTSIGIEECLPDNKLKDFWVPKMHQLNIERYIEWKIQGISVDTLDFSNHNDIKNI